MKAPNEPTNLVLLPPISTQPATVSRDQSTVARFLTVAARERRDSNLSLAAEYRQKLAWSVFQLAYEARTTAARLAAIHKDMAYDQPIDSPIAIRRPPRRFGLRLVWSAREAT